MKTFAKRMYVFFTELDPRVPVAAILFTYLVLGLTVLGFNRSPAQAIVTTITCCTLEVILTYIFKKKWIFPLSAMITSFSLSFLLNYSHDFLLVFIPIFFAIGSKYILQFNGKHFFNPAMMGVALSLLFAEDLVTASPAYQWNGIATMSIFIIALGLIFVIPKVSRTWLVLSFLFFFSIQTALRAFIMKHHLPFETLFLGTLSSPAFFIFTFFMITDPASSPKTKKDQIIVGFSLATVDLLLHLYQSYYTFFYAALIVAGVRFAWFHYKQAKQKGYFEYFIKDMIASRYYLQPAAMIFIAVAWIGLYSQWWRVDRGQSEFNWTLEKIPAQHSGLNVASRGDILDRVDPRVQHIAKWILSEADSASVGDVNNDGLPDLFLSQTLKDADKKYMLYINKGDFHFEEFPIPEVNAIRHNPEQLGIVANAVFVDYDNDNDQDLFLTVGFGKSILLKNELSETKTLKFKDVTVSAGITEQTQSISASFGDFNKDGLLDLLVLNVWPNNFPDYPKAQHLNIFNLPKPEYEGDIRMFNFMHDSWHQSNNGGENQIYFQNPDHTFTLMDAKKMGLPETRWSLAVGIADLNQDSWPDFYIANDFGPDDVYLNRNGKFFENVKGTIFGSIGKDTYKGMNVSIADFDRDLNFGVYISNVHHAFQAEGSLLWKVIVKPDKFYPEFIEVASKRGVLNEQRFGWGASATDFDNDGWVDIAQANGMVDDQFDKKFDTCKDYWYVNEKVARSAPYIHKYANNWGDLRGYCIYGKERIRLYKNRGVASYPQFKDIATEVGVSDLNSARGIVSFDLNNDGRRDILVTHPFLAPTLYKNTLKNQSVRAPHWIGFDIESLSAECNREAIGSLATLQVTKNDDSQFQIMQEKQVVSGFASQSDKRLHFGLGNDIKTLSVKINWCGKKSVIYDNLELDKYHTIVYDKEQMAHNASK
ncbi:MAG: VCBS repeat-containing protein [Bdellovibrionaceae bacterium]|nr:VCBS repeat-containing protein [Pseudobdellovibrionaceae bacterium]